MLLVSLRAFAQVFPGADWEEATPESQGVDSVKLDAAMEYLANVCGSDGTTQSVVIRNGYMIWKGSDIDFRHRTWSCTKSFTSTVLGLLIDDGKCTLDTLAKDHLPVLAAQYPDVTLRHFTTMTSGYDGGGDQAQSWYIPTTPLFAPGTKYQYWDSAMNQFGNVLTHIADESMYELFKRRIADPIGMINWDWAGGRVFDGLTVNGGAGNIGGIAISARDMARFGYLFLNRGNWNGQQLISTSWVDQAGSVQVPASMPYGGERARGMGVYGFNWWVNGYKPEGERNYPKAPPNMFSANGHQNNMCFVIPEWNMVIVRLGLDDNISNSNYSWFLGMVGEAITDRTFPGATWETKTPTEVDMDAAKLDQLASALGGRGCVVRHGYVVKSWGSQSSIGWWASSSNPVLSTLLFYAIKEGKVSSVDGLVDPWWNNALIAKDKTMTFRHLGTMTSGYARGEAPGAAWAYNDYAIQLYVKTLAEKIFQQELYAAITDPARLGALQFEDGFSGRYISTSVRNWARICWFWLNKGNWNGTQLLDRSFFDNYMKSQVPHDLPSSTQGGSDYLGIGTFGGGSAHWTDYGPGIYGFNWWFNGTGRLHPSTNVWPDAPMDTIMTIGVGGNNSVIIPSLDLVLVASGNWGGSQHADFNGLIKLLVEAPEYTITISSTTGGTTDPFVGSYTYYDRTEVSITAIPDNDYGFYNWTGNVPSGYENYNPITITMDSDKTITANFSAIYKGERDSGGKKWCFIATAAYDSPLHPYVNTLRDFRDTYLMPSKIGGKIVDIYYKYSPFVANFITKHKALKAAVRFSLLPMIAFSYSMIHFGPIITIAMLVIISMFPIFLFSFFRRRLSRLEAKYPKAMASLV